MHIYESSLGYCGDPQQITTPIKEAYLVYSKFGWCQIRQAFAEELYSAYRTSKNNEFGTANWIDAYKEAQTVIDILEYNYVDKPMFMGAEPDEVVWNRLWCIAWWYANHSSQDRQIIRTNLSKRTYPLDISFEDITITDELVNSSSCQDRSFLSESRHDEEPKCIPIPLEWGEKILAVLGGAVLGGIGVVTVIWLSKDKNNR